MIKQKTASSRFSARLLSALLSALLVIGTLTAVPVFADNSFSDISSHWAKNNIEYMVAKEILNGYTDGTFRPDREVTRAEFIKMLDATFGLTATKSISFSDVEQSQWYYPYIQQAAAQGYLLDYGSNLNPNGQLSREEACALLARYLNLEELDRAGISFSDVTSIRSDYRGYIYACVAAGIIKGYDAGNGTTEFRPQRVLTRAEALAILYRSAGTIYRSSANGADSAAQAGNAIITKGNVTITNGNFSGTVYITEGAGSGTVTLSNCSITGTLYMRGSSKVQLVGSRVNNIVVIGNDDSFVGVNLDETSSVTTVDAQSPTAVYLQRGSQINTLTIGQHAENSTVTGSGTIRQLNINGARFKSDITPTNYTIGDRITAEIAGNSVGGSGTSRTGLYPGTNATVDTTGSRDVLTVTPNQSAVLFWYYTNATSAPSAENYRSNYDRASSNIKGYQTLDQVKSYTVTMAPGNVASQYNNIVVCLYSNQEYFDPVLLSRTGANNNNTAASGFTTSPKVTTSQLTNLDTLTFVPGASGTVSYYYTQSSAAVDSNQFNTNYGAAASGLKGSMSVVSGNNYSPTTSYNPVVSGAGYSYVAVMLTSGGVNYQPVIVTRNAADNSNLSASGLADVPAWSSYSGNESLKINSNISGTMKYYYTSSSTVPNAQTFMSYYGMPGTHYNAIQVSQGSNNKYLTTTVTNTDGTTKQENIKTSVVNASNLGYIVIMLTDGMGNNYAPYVVPRQDVSETGGGFKERPTVTVSAQGDTISFTPSVTGYVFWYYSTSGASVSAGNFMTNWNNALTSVRGQSGQAAANVAQTIQGASAMNLSTLTSYNYVVLALQDTTGQLQTPIVIARTQSNNATYGFRVNPTVATNVGGNDVMSLTSQYTGTVYYYYSNSASTISNYNTFNSNYNTASVKSSFSVTAGSPVTVNTAATTSVASNLQYVVVMLRDNSGVYYSPYTIRRGAASTTGTGLSAASVTTGTVNDTISVTASVTGVLQYYYTNSNIQIDSASFANNFNATTFRGTVNVTANTPASFNGYSNNYVSNLPYVAMMLTSNGINYTPVIIARNGANGLLPSNTGAGFISGPAVTLQTVLGGNVYYATGTTSVAGTVYYYFSNNYGAVDSNSFVNNWSSFNNGGSFNVNANTQFQQQLTLNALNSGMYNTVVFMLAVGNTYYNPVSVMLNGSSGSSNISGYASASGMSAVIAANGTYTVTGIPTASGTLYYYASTNVPSTSDMVSAIKSGNALIQRYGNVTSGFSFSISNIPATATRLSVVLYDGINYYQVSSAVLAGGSGSSGSNANSSTGLKDTMTVVINGTTYFNYIPNVDGRMYWYTASANTNPGASNYMYSWASAANSGVNDTLKKDQSYYIDLSALAGGTDKFLIIQYVSSTNTAYAPQVINLP